MKVNVYSIRDVHTGFLSPTFEPNDAVAIRNFEHAVLNSTGVLTSHAEDFDLFQIGNYDDENGCLTPIQPPILIVKGSAVYASRV